jgi:outer membrane receptor protein involved in Fe transport
MLFSRVDLAGYFVIGVLLLQPATAISQERLDPIVVTATRNEQRAFELPLSIDSLDAAQIQQNQLQINLSESLVRVPGLSVQNRWNYAQDLQVSSRGFGARGLWRSRHQALSGRHSGDHARRAGADGQFQPRVGEAHRSAARAVLHLVRERRGRRDFGVHRGRPGAAAGTGANHRWKLNTDAAPRYVVANVRAGLEQHYGVWTLREFVRVNNLADRNYVGSVIVADTNSRFFEPAGRRNYLAGITVNAQF